MRNLILLFVAILSTSSTIIVDNDLKFEITNVKNVKNNFLRLTLKLTNTSDKEFKFFTWKCSNQKLFQTNNILIEIPKNQCNEDRIVINKLSPNKSKTFKLKVLNNGENPKFKITFNCTMIPETKQVRTIEIVSNEIQL